MLQTWQKTLPILLNPIKTTVRLRILVATLLKFSTKGGRYNCIKIEMVKGANPYKEGEETWSDFIPIPDSR